MHETLLVPVLTYGSEIRVDRVPNAWIRDLCRVTKGVYERVDEGLAMWRGWKGLLRESI